MDKQGGKKKRAGRDKDTRTAATPIFLEKPKMVVITTYLDINNSATEVGQQDTEGLSQNDLLVVTVQSVIQQSGEKQVPMFTLEQEVCKRLQEINETHIPSFDYVQKLKFRQFLEKNCLHFDLEKSTKTNCETLVSIRKSKKKTRKSPGDKRTDTGGRTVASSASSSLETTVTTEEEGEAAVVKWKTVTNAARATRATASPQSNEAQSRPESAQENRKSAAVEVVKDDKEGERFVNTLLQRYTGYPDSVILVRSPDEYERDRVKLTQDVVSIWNSPNRGRVFILIGVGLRTKSKPPHRIVGLRRSLEKDFFHTLFHSELFHLQPQFSYEEFKHSGKLVGVITIEENYGKGFPSYIMSNDQAPRLQKDQLWVRKCGQNSLISPSDVFVSHIHAWFLQITRPSAVRSVRSPDNLSSSPQPVASPQASGPDLKASSELSPPSANSKPESSSEEDGAGSVRKLLKFLDHFKKGHFVLMCGSLATNCINVEALSFPPWLAVYDFDFHGRDTGLLGVLEDNIKTRRCLRVLTWRDAHSGLKERGTQWWSMRGRRDVPDSIIKDTPYTHVQWFKRARDKVEKLCVELARFSEDCAVLTFLILWPASPLEGSCIYKFLSRLQDHEHILLKIAICCTDLRTDPTSIMDIQMIQRDFGELVEVFHVSLRDLCTEVKRLHRPDTPLPVFSHTLPAADSKTATISETDAMWLAEDLDALFLQSPHRKLTAEDLKKEADNFFRGGTISWYVWYEIGRNYLDVERHIAKEMIEVISNMYIDDCKTGMVTLYHAPGSGGSTLAQQVLWSLREKAPCVQVRHRAWSSIEELADRLIFLHNLTHLPVVVLLDGEDEPRLKSLSMQLQRHTVVMLNVKRYPYPMEGTHKPVIGNNFYLSGIVKKKESRNLVLRFRERCENDHVKVEALTKLDEDVQEERENHQLYEYGMTVYHHEFKGVRAFVRGYLQLDKKTKDLQAWQICLGFLSLVYYYGQSSLPCQFFTSILGKPSNYTLEIEDFPHPLEMFIVRDTNASKGQNVRICHYFVAKEILEQILNRNIDRDQDDRGPAEGLSRDAKRNLKDFCLTFINHAVKSKTKRSLTANTTAYILTKTFIFRDYREMSSIEAPKSPKKSQFSQIMSDVDPSPPYQGRLEIIQKLCTTFPDDPNFRAHLGRFYTCCRPEEGDQAQKHFTDALKLCFERKNFLEQSDQDDRTIKLSLMHIYHMYGTFFQVRLARYISSHKDLGVLSREKLLTVLEGAVPDAVQACDKFFLCRTNTPCGYEENYTYDNEIHVRLQICDFVKTLFPGGMKGFLSIRNPGLIYGFVKDSLTEVEDLIMECFHVVFLDSVNIVHLQKKVQWFNELFRGCTLEMKGLAQDDDLTSLRLNITTKKLQYRDEGVVMSVDSPTMPRDEIEIVVAMLEEIFHLENLFHGSVKSKLDLDYRDWITAIRNPNFTKTYSLEKVKEHVLNWNDSVRSPQSTFYVFVLNSLLGFGTDSRPGLTENLLEAQMLLEDRLQKLSKIVQRPRCPREWLGRADVDGIRRLVPGTSIARHVEGRSIKDNNSRAKLAICKGTIRPHNKKLAGFIDLDLGENTTPVKVFYIPMFAKLEGSRFSGERVQFYLAFTLENGYEAYDVKLLKKYTCGNCYLKLEMTTEQTEVKCRCGMQVTRAEHLEAEEDG